MTGPDLESAFNDCVEALRAGKSLEECLGRYPEHRADLEPLLGVVAEVWSVPRPALSPAAARIGEARLRRAVAGRRRPLYRQAGLGWLTAAAVLLLVLLGLGSTVAAAQGSTDGPLSGLRVAAERLQLTIARSPAEQADIQLAGVERRLDSLATQVGRGSPPPDGSLPEFEDKLKAALEKVEELPPPEAASRINRAIGLVARQRAIIEAVGDDESDSNRADELARREKQLTEKLRQIAGQAAQKAGPPARTPAHSLGQAPQQDPSERPGRPGRGR